jgi:hypothetical protein
MDKNFDWFLQKFGSPTSSKAADSSVLDRYRGKLPDQLLRYWEHYGFSGFRGGLFWIVDPREYEPALDEWLDDTPIVEKDAYHVIARSGFGALMLWGEKTGYRYEIDCPRGWIIEREGDQADIGAGDADGAISRFFAIRKLKHFDICDEAGNGLFDSLVDKFGPLSADDVFAFEPSLMVGGVPSVENTSKRNVHVHLSLLAQLGQREIVDRQAMMRKAFG